MELKLTKFRPLNSQELRLWLSHLGPLVLGAKVEGVWCHTKAMVIYFDRGGQFVIDLDNLFPWVGVYDQLPPSWTREKKTTPLGLFLKAHFLKATLIDIEVVEHERIFHLHFVGTSPEATDLKLSAVLIPRSVNIILQDGEKKLSLHKPKDLPPPIEGQSFEAQFDSIHEISELWLHKIQRASGGGIAKSRQTQKNWERELAKKRRIIAELEENLGVDRSYRELGEKLKIYSYEELSDSLKDLYDLKKSLSENMENAFAQAKHHERKKQAWSDRIEKLKEELHELTVAAESGADAAVIMASKKRNSDKAKKQFLASAEAKGRSKKLDKEYEVIVGKTARDNLALLRRSKPWFVWMHLRDYPGAHAICFGPKKGNPDIGVLREAAQFLLQCSLKEKHFSEGSKYEVVWAPCSQVRPIKGDKLGRVTYHDAHTLLVTL